jgi:hypothetical protein
LAEAHHLIAPCDVLLLQRPKGELLRVEWKWFRQSQETCGRADNSRRDDLITRATNVTNEAAFALVVAATLNDAFIHR